MTIARFRLDSDYYKEDLSQWVRYVSKWRRYEPYISVIFLCIGIGLFLTDYHGTALIVFFIVAGIFEGTSHFLMRVKWLNARKQDKHYNQTVEFTINNGKMKQIKPEPIDDLRPVVKIIEVPKGYFMYLEDKNRIYIPKLSLEPLGVPLK